MAVFPYRPSLERKLTTYTHFEEVVKLCERRGSSLLVPRNLVSDRSYATRALRTYPLTSSFKPRSGNQRRFVNEIYSFLKSRKSGIASASTGFGKTYCACDVIARLGYKTLIVVTKKDIMEQWLKAINVVMGIPIKDIGIIQGKTMKTDSPVVVGMVQTLANEGWPENLTNAFGLVVFDEVHRMGAEHFSRAVKAFNSPIRLGLSATPKRKDGRDVVFWANIGPVRVITHDLPMTPDIFVYKTQSELSEKIEEEMVSGRISREVGILSRDPERNKLICDLVMHCYLKKRNTVVFVELIDHITSLGLSLIKLGLPYEDLGLYVGGLSPKNREKAKRKKVVLATYRMTSEATDVPWWDTAVMTSPKSEVEQIVGRVTREHPGKPTPVVFDILDHKVKVFEKFYKRRLKWYKKIGAKIVVKERYRPGIM